MTNKTDHSSGFKVTKTDFGTAILERKKAVNRLLVDDAIAVSDNNSVVTLHPVTDRDFTTYVNGLKTHIILARITRLL
ncbi:hypothetical protein TB2_024893 [Malus domestica]